MPSSGAVYQPTTVQCEGGAEPVLGRHGGIAAVGSILGNGGGDSPVGESIFAGLGLGLGRTAAHGSATERWRCTKTVSQRFGEWFTGPRCLLWGTLLLGLALTGAGIKVTIDSANSESNNSLIEGIVLLLFGIPLLVFFVGILIRRQRGWAGGKGGIESGNGGNGSLGAPNPSTDPLVAAQYAPVKDAPPSVDDDERRQLMDNKECLSSAEESDKLVESDPRIVLKPLKNTEDA